MSSFTDGAPHNGAPTSRAAAASVSRRVARDKDRIIGSLATSGAHGATCDELEDALNLPHQTTSARVRDLAKRRVILNSGRTRATRYGRKAIVWTLRGTGR